MRTGVAFFIAPRSAFRKQPEIFYLKRRGEEESRGREKNSFVMVSF
jgi:hypothetical protein